MSRRSTPATAPKSILLNDVPSDVYNAVRSAATLSDQSMRDVVIDLVRNNLMNVQPGSSAEDVLTVSRQAYANTITMSSNSTVAPTATYTTMIQAISQASPQVVRAVSKLAAPAQEKPNV
jgi:hypothetical protein